MSGGAGAPGGRGAGSAVASLARHRLRRRWVAVTALAVVVVLGLGGGLVALGAAIRTDRAYGDFLDEAGVGDLVVNPALSDRQVDDVLRAVPEAVRVTRDAMFLAGLDDGHPRARAEFEAEPNTVLIRGSTDGRRTEMDRPAFSAGRAIREPDEVLVTADLADRLDLAPGDPLQISFWDSQDDVTAELEDVVEPIAVEDVTVAGVITLHDEVLPDDLYPRGQVIVSPELTATYDCLADLPAVDASFEEVVPLLLPRGCATSYPYYSLDIDGGRDVVASVIEDLGDAFTELDELVPAVLLEQDVHHAVIATTTADEATRVERSTQPTVAAFAVLALGVAVLLVVIVGFAAAREIRSAGSDVRIWRQAGITSGQRATVLAVPLALAVVAGSLGALAVAWLASPVAPVGAVRALDPDPGRQLPVPVLLAGLAVALALVAMLVGLALRASRRAGATTAAAPSGRRGLGQLAARGNRPPLAEGLRAAFGSNRSAGLVAGSGAVAVGVLLAAVVFGGSLRNVVDSPEEYGWRWDAALMGGFGYGRQDIEQIRASLDGRDDLEHWDGLAIASYAVDGEPAIGLVGLGDDGPLELTMAEGRMPGRAGEVALGSRTAAAIDAEVGDTVEITGDLVEAHPAKVTGIVVLPALGPYQSDRTSPGYGIVLDPGDVGVEAAERAITFVCVDVADGVDARATVDELRDDIADWAVEGDYTFEYLDPVRPPEIVETRAMRSVPLFVGGLLAAAAGIGLLTSVVVSVRSRRRELGTLRALGFTGRQLRSSVRVQTVATMGLATALGVPLGLALGRALWRAFASRLGVVTDPAMPWGWTAATVAVAVVLAVVAAAYPARVAARLDAAEALRSD